MSTSFDSSSSFDSAMSFDPPDAGGSFAQSQVATKSGVSGRAPVRALPDRDKPALGYYLRLQFTTYEGDIDTEGDPVCVDDPPCPSCDEPGSGSGGNGSGGGGGGDGGNGSCVPCEDCDGPPPDWFLPNGNNDFSVPPSPFSRQGLWPIVCRNNCDRPGFGCDDGGGGGTGNPNPVPVLINEYTTYDVPGDLTVVPGGEECVDIFVCDFDCGA